MFFGVTDHHKWSGLVWPFSSPLKTPREQLFSFLMAPGSGQIKCQTIQTFYCPDAAWTGAYIRIYRYLEIWADSLIWRCCILALSNKFSNISCPMLCSLQRLSTSSLFFLCTNKVFDLDLTHFGNREFAVGSGYPTKKSSPKLDKQISLVINKICYEVNWS